MLRWLLLLLLPFLLLLLLLLPAVAPRGHPRAGLAWLASLQRRLARGALGWAAAWQRHRLEQGTRHTSWSQQQALVWCLRGPRRAPRGNTGV